METENTISIRAPYQRIFTLASRIEDWGRILPHYRYVHTLRENGNRRLAKMSARRGLIPVTWTAEQTVIEGTVGSPGRIQFHHVKGFVRGMDVEWTFVAQADGSYLVRIAHKLAVVPFPTRLLGRRLVEVIVGRGFIGHIAGQTLKRIKALSEDRVVGNSENGTVEDVLDDRAGLK